MDCTVRLAAGRPALTVHSYHEQDGGAGGGEEEEMFSEASTCDLLLFFFFWKVKGQGVKNLKSYCFGREDSVFQSLSFVFQVA